MNSVCYFSIIWILLFLSAVTLSNPSKGKFDYGCEPKSALVVFTPQLSHEGHMWIKGKTKKCRMHLKLNETSVFELNFEKCTGGRKLFKVVIHEHEHQKLSGYSVLTGTFTTKLINCSAN